MILSEFLRRRGEVNIRTVIFTSPQAIKKAPKALEECGIKISLDRFNMENNIKIIYLQLKVKQTPGVLVDYEDDEGNYYIERSEEETENDTLQPKELNQAEDSTARQDDLMVDGDDTDNDETQATTGKDYVGYNSQSNPIDFQTSVQILGFLILVGIIFLIGIQTKILNALRKLKKR